MRHPVLITQVTNPVAGADWSVRLSDIDAVKIISVTAQLATSVAVANRHPALVLTNRDGVQYLGQDAQFAQAASLTVTYSWAKDLANPLQASASGGTRPGFPFPSLWLEPGDKLSTSTNLIDAADQWSNIFVRYITGEHWKRWEESAQFYELLTG